MPPVLHAETRKLLARRGLLVALAALTLAAGAAPLLVARLLPAVAQAPGQDLQRALLVGGWLTATVVLFVAARSVAREYVDGSIASTLLAVPRRGRLLLAQAACFGLLGGGLALLAGAVGILCLLAVPLDQDLPLNALGVLRSLAGTVVLGTGAGALGAAVGVAARGRVVPTALLVGGGYLAASLLAIVVLGGGTRLPGELGDLLVAPTTSAEGLPAQLAAAAAHLGYVAMAMAVARIRLGRWQWRAAAGPSPVRRATAG